MIGRWWRIALGLAFVTAAIVLFRHDLTAAAELLRERLTAVTAAGILICAALHFVNEPLRWWVLLRRQTPPARWGQTYHAIMVTSLTSYTFPARLGVPVRVLMGRRILGLDYVTTGALLLADSTLNYALWGVAGIAGIVTLLPRSSLLLPAELIVVAAAGVVAVMVATRQGWMLANRPHLAASLQLLSLPAAMCNVALLTFDIVMLGIRHTFILSALGVDPSFVTVTLAVATSIVAGFLSPLPLGLGTYDVSLAYLLISVGVAREVAIAVPLINRVASLLVAVTLGGTSLARLGINLRAELSTATASTLTPPTRSTENAS